MIQVSLTALLAYASRHVCTDLYKRRSSSGDGSDTRNQRDG
jgi:hypothetical protein